MDDDVMTFLLAQVLLVTPWIRTSPLGFRVIGEPDRAKIAAIDTAYLEQAKDPSALLFPPAVTISFFPQTVQAGGCLRPVLWAVLDNDPLAGWTVVASEPGQLPAAFAHLLRHWFKFPPEPPMAQSGKECIE